ncbi:hypothetical protein B0I35DRAFT_364935 [Stachybotrys elegans]|uniref:LYC1 C-terminal domain-containing protein n=1 Tax=Stachybotrys elegans TaxID=80388 RepID=A0A8K0WJJ2_9HYPO|nr:hypothetical protein B0I35DRAFT_364935 [Stachybotrys elegans]
MPQSMPVTINGPDGPLEAILGEATSAQRVACWELASVVFAPQIPASLFVEHLKTMFNHKLVRDNGERYWCISRADDPMTVMAMCGTIRRAFLIRDNESMREEEGFCIFAVATHIQYRRLGLAKMIMKYVSEWLDGDARAPVSMLYTSVGDFYVSMGWEMLSANASTIRASTGSFGEPSQSGLPFSRFLSDDEMPELCERDVQDLKESFEKVSVGADEVHLAVIPNHDIISYLHEWGDVASAGIQGKTSPNHGAICEAADTWMTWHHRLDKLVITRVRTPPGNKPGDSESLASLLLLAVDEARNLGFSTIVVWEPSEGLLQALELVKNDSTIVVETAARSNSITSVRWKGSNQARKTILHLNENYAAS